MDDLLQYCREHGLRITVSLRAVLLALSEAKLPQSLQDLEVTKHLKDACDRATIFRILQRLEGIGLLRRLNFSHSAARFALNTGEGHSEYLICRICGDVQILNKCCPVKQLEEQLAESSGFTALTHELTFYGVCASCSTKP